MANGPKNPADAASRVTLRPPHSGDDHSPFDKLVPSLKSPVSVPLGRLEQTVFTRINGQRSVLEISQEVGLTPFEVLRILERLEQLVPDLKVGQSEDVVELTVDQQWEDDDEPLDATTAEIPAASKR